MTPNREERRARARVAKRPPARTVEVTIDEGAFDGWYLKARADFPAGLLADLQSQDVGRILGVLDAIVLDHNLPNGDGELATPLATVEPYDGLLVLAGQLFDELGRLPPR